MKESNKFAPIFIVGVPRSGTTLLAAMLAAHSRLSCGTETRFFNFLSQVDSGQLIDPKCWPNLAVDFLFRVKLVDIPVPEHYKFDREQIRAFLDDRPASIPAVLASLTEQFMIREGKKRWIEKSPEHLLFVRDIRYFFPKSPIIRIVRDPRDTALSLNKAPWAPPDFLDAIMLWRKYDLASREFFQDDQNSLTVHYEAILKSPERELQRVCDFIGETFEISMLDTSKSADKLVTKRDSWHRIVDKPVDTSRMGVWKRELNGELIRQTEALIGDRISSYGFERIEVFDSVAQVYPSLEALLKYRKGLSALVEKDIRFWAERDGEKETISVYVGLPDKDNWLRYSKPERWGDIMNILFRIFLDRLNGRRVYWIRDRALEKYSGSATGLISSIIRLAESRLDLAE